ncbi:Uncharacterized protein BP5553_02551 [Venustampulla echinocandica]|uniref:DNA repair protein XRCC4 n=1 Tax=Venustampulla echinocandica TaxID=2656787 RepID=A0A370TRR9_9HELO|nr:Uncharacterized protein BP5553_02551 [Venustampulla echinocandica]RDL38211.1 Uncharacterized protein BP5553_02551 [Venustampulla echinocandica]
MDPDCEALLRLPRLDHAADEASFVLVHVSSAGRRQLDLKLIGTEQETVFSVALKHTQISSLVVKNSPCNQEEWEAILLFVLRGSLPETTNEGPDVCKGVEAVAKVEKNATSLTITIQKRIQGITQRLGTLSLPATEDEEVFLYEWCGSAIVAKDSASEELQIARSNLREKDAQVKKLEESFNELVNLKNSHEKALLEKFSLLLNEKKLKIRDQQRLLSSSNIDLAKHETGPRIKNTSARAGPSRAGKRKMGEDTQALKDDESDDEQMDIDNEAAQSPANDSEQEEAHTPDPESTASEAESESDGPLVLQRPRRTADTSKGIAKGSTAHTKEAGSSHASQDVSPPPPKRDLPFQQKKATKPEPVDGSETESDDEL